MSLLIVVQFSGCLRRNEDCRTLSDHIIREGVVQRCSVKKVFLDNLQNLQENTCEFCDSGTPVNFVTLAQVFSCEFCEFSKNTFLHRTPLVAASVIK